MKTHRYSLNSSLILAGNSQPTWLLTFSDLLTLLLTFFVVRYALIHQNPEQVKKSLPTIESNAQETSINFVGPEMSNLSSSPLELNENIFQPESTTLTFDNSIKIRSIAKALVARQAKSIIIYTETPVGLDDHKWRLAGNRAKEIYRQFIDAGVERKSISLSFYNLTPKDNKTLPDFADNVRGEVKIMIKGIK